jgi:hypothetical protein
MNVDLSSLLVDSLNATLCAFTLSFCLNNDPSPLNSFGQACTPHASAGGFGGIIGENMIFENPKIHPVNPSNPKILIYEQRIEIRCYKIQPRLRLCTKMAGVKPPKYHLSVPKNTNLLSKN